MLTFIWFIAWLIGGDGVVSVDPQVGGWAITLIVCASIDFVIALVSDN